MVPFVPGERAVGARAYFWLATGYCALTALGYHGWARRRRRGRGPGPALGAWLWTDTLVYLALSCVWAMLVSVAVPRTR